MSEANLLIAIVKANPGIHVTCGSMHEVIKEVFQETGTLIRVENHIERWTHWGTNWRGDEVPYERKRFMKREFYLTIQ